MAEDGKTCADCNLVRAVAQAALALLNEKAKPPRRLESARGPET